MSNEWTRYHHIPITQGVEPSRKASDEVHLAAEKAWQSSYCEVAGLAPETNVLIPILGPAVDTAYELGRQKAANDIKKWCDENDWKFEHGSGFDGNELYKIALGED